MIIVFFCLWKGVRKGGIVILFLIFFKGFFFVSYVFFIRVWVFFVFGVRVILVWIRDWGRRNVVFGF